MNSDQDDRTFWLTSIALCIALVWIIYKFPKTSAAIIARPTRDFLLIVHTLCRGAPKALAAHQNCRGIFRGKAVDFSGENVASEI